MDINQLIILAKKEYDKLIQMQYEVTSYSQNSKYTQLGTLRNLIIQLTYYGKRW